MGDDVIAWALDDVPPHVPPSGSRPVRTSSRAGRPVCLLAPTVRGSHRSDPRRLAYLRPGAPALAIDRGQASSRCGSGAERAACSRDRPAGSWRKRKHSRAAPRLSQRRTAPLVGRPVS
jgi:hypothetical protein